MTRGFALTLDVDYPFLSFVTFLTKKLDNLGQSKLSATSITFITAKSITSSPHIRAEA